MNTNRIARAVLAVALAVASPWALSQPTGQTGWTDNGPGWGYAMGYGGFPGYGYGYGMGMMGGYGFAPGVGAGPRPIVNLNLTQDQQQKVNSIQDQLRKQALNVQNQILDQQARLRDLYNEEQPDPRQVGDAYSRIGNLQAQIAQAQTQAQNQIRNVLTPQQQQQLAQARRQFGPAYGAPGTGYFGPYFGP